jgi:U3 small nucleolar RNA-associated protein 25
MNKLMYPMYISHIGQVRVKQLCVDGKIAQVISRVEQVFQRIPCDSFETEAEVRFDYFKEHVLSQVLRLDQAHTLIVSPSYMHYVSIRNELMRREVSGPLHLYYRKIHTT